MRRLLLADDLTGAGDAGVQFAKAGLRTTVWLNHERCVAAADGEVVVVDVDSRQISADAAYARMRSVLAQFAPVRPRELIKKIDSTLRGHLGPELRAMLDALPGAFAIVCPAYPKNRRTLRDGILEVDGIPVDRTDFGRDLFTPVRDARVAAHLGVPSVAFDLALVRASTAALDAAVDRARQAGLRAAVVDAQTDADLRAIAALAALREDLLWVGSAGLIEMLGDSAPAGGSRAPAGPLAGPIAFLIGSLSAMTQQQVDTFAADPGVGTERIDPVAALEGDLSVPVARACAALSQGRDVLLALSGEREGVEQALAWGRAREWDAARTSHALRERFIDETAPLAGAGAGAFVLSGGDVARSFCERHGVQGLALLAEAAPGIPLSRAIGADLLLVTKAGGFGQRETYREIVATLRSQVTA